MTGSRRARYRSLAKTHLEHVYSAVALNLIRCPSQNNAGDFARCPSSVSEVQLEAKLGVARTTVRKAVGGLRDEGLLITTPGMDSFVTGSPKE